MWTKDYLVRGLIRRARRPPRWRGPLKSTAPGWLAGGKAWTAQDEWQALYRVEEARRLLKAARREAAEQRRLVLLWDAQKTRAAVAAAEWLAVAEKNKEEQDRVRATQAERRAKEGAEMAAEVQKEVTDQTIWCAWAWANGKKQTQIAKELGFGNSTQVNQECRRYVLAHYPQNLYRGSGYARRVEHLGDRRTLVRLALEGKPEPPRPERWREVALPEMPLPKMPPAPPEIPKGRQPPTSAAVWREVSRRRHRWVLEQRRAGRTLEQIAAVLGLSKERIREMQRAAERYEAKGARQWYAERAAEGLGRPLDIDANGEDYRGKWLYDEA